MSASFPLVPLLWFNFFANACQFGIYNSNEAYAASLGWTRMNFSVWQHRKYQFWEDYTRPETAGIDPIESRFYVSGCTICLEKNYALTVVIPNYGDEVLLAAPQNGSTSYCANLQYPLLTNSYRYQILPFFSPWRNYTLTNSSEGNPVCTGDLTLALYYKDCTATPTISPTPAPTSNPTALECFGIYSTDPTDSIAEKWIRLDLGMLNSYGQQLIEEYNTYGGLKLILPFTPDICVFTLNDTHYLTLNNTLIAASELYNRACYISNRVKFYPLLQSQAYMSLTNDWLPFRAHNFSIDLTFLAFYYRKTCLPTTTTTSPTLNLSFTSTVIPTEEPDNESEGTKSFGMPLSDYRSILIFAVIASVSMCFVCVCVFKCCFKKKKNKSMGVERQMSDLTNKR